MPENASCAVRLEVLSHVVASRAVSSGPKISANKLRQILAHPALAALTPYEDPAEEPFCVEFGFSGTAYLGTAGIAQDAEFMLSALRDAILSEAGESLPEDFKARASALIRSAMILSNSSARVAGLRRGIRPSSAVDGVISVPPAEAFRRLKAATIFTLEQVRSHFSQAGMSADVLDSLISSSGGDYLGGYSFDGGPLALAPFIRHEQNLVLLIPGAVFSAVRHSILVLAEAASLKEQLAEAYNAAVWKSVLTSFSFTRNPRLRFSSNRADRKYVADGVFRLDFDKVIYCVLLTDPLVRRVSDVSTDWVGDGLSDIVQKVVDNAERQVLSSLPSPTDVFTVVVMQGLGTPGVLSLRKSASGCPLLLLSAAALRTLSLIEGGDSLALYNFARARALAHSKVEIRSTNILDEFRLYSQSNYSFYFSDKELPDIAVIPPGDCLALHMEVAAKRDPHVARTPEGGSTEVIAMYDTASIPIFGAPQDVGGRVRMLVEGGPLPVWVTVSSETQPESSADFCLTFVEALTYWIWQFTPTITPLLAPFGDAAPIDLRVILPTAASLRNEVAQSADSGIDGVAVEVDRAAQRITLEVNPALFSLARATDNRAERELLRQVLVGFATLSRQAHGTPLTAIDVQNSLDRIAPLGLKRMLLIFDLNETPEVNDSDLLPYRRLQMRWVSELLDRIGEHLITAMDARIGDIDADDRVRTLNAIVKFCFEQMSKLAATLSADGLLEFAMVCTEAVHREQAMSRVTIPTKLECFGSAPEMVEQLRKKIPELANIGLAGRFLVEYLVSQPPRGYRPVSVDVIDELNAWAYHIVNYAMLSDGINAGLGPYALSVLPSRRLGIDGSVWQATVDGHLRAFAIDQMESTTESVRARNKPKDERGSRDAFRRDLDSVTREEFGEPLSSLLEVMEAAIAVAQDLERGIRVVTESQCLRVLSTRTGRAELDVAKLLNLLSLGPRSSFLTPIEGYRKTDLYPWRFNRPLSYMRRPFLRFERDGESMVMWGVRHMRQSQRFLVDQCVSGKLKPKTRVMQEFVSKRTNEVGSLFNDKVADFFAGLAGIAVERRVKKIGELRELQTHLGDIDVLVGDVNRGRILVVECKDLSVARTPYEMARELIEIFGGGNDAKSTVSKH
ncbi:MAG: hypothetical protein ABSC71_11875, partial [Candidatus Acidiferrales bacterium]